MVILQGIAEKLQGTGNMRLKFKAVPWTEDDGKAFPDGQHVAFTHWAKESKEKGAKKDEQVGVFQYCSKPSGEALNDFMPEVRLHELTRARRPVGPQDSPDRRSRPRVPSGSARLRRSPSSPSATPTICAFAPTTAPGPITESTTRASSLDDGARSSPASLTRAVADPRPRHHHTAVAHLGRAYQASRVATPSAPRRSLVSTRGMGRSDAEYDVTDAATSASGVPTSRQQASSTNLT